jgi:tRNA(Ile)-lysidine synthase
VGQGALSSKPLVETSIGLYDTFLPRFDLMMANSIAALFGRDRYLAPPVHDVLTEKTG